MLLGASDLGAWRWGRKATGFGWLAGEAAGKGADPTERGVVEGQTHAGRTFTMRMKARMWFYAILFLFGGVLVGAIGLEVLDSIIPMIVWFFVFAAAQFLIFRCPHYRKLATSTHRGAATPFLGDRCRYCQREY